MKLNGKGYIQNGEGFLITSTGERYHYHEGKLTRTSAQADRQHSTPDTYRND